MQMPRTISSTVTPACEGNVERLDDFAFDQRVHLGDDVPLFAASGSLRFGLDGSDYIRLQGERGLPQMAQGTSLA